MTSIPLLSVANLRTYFYTSAGVARAVFEQSLREAVRRGDGYIGVEHLLLASLQDESGGACRTLEALGVDPRAVREALIAGGIPAEAITTAWKGESENAVPTEDGVKEQANRRAEIIIQ